MELTIELTLLTQQLAYRRHQTERDQVRNSYMCMDHVQYRGNLYLKHIMWVGNITLTSHGRQIKMLLNLHKKRSQNLKM